MEELKCRYCGENIPYPIVGADKSYICPHCGKRQKDNSIYRVFFYIVFAATCSLVVGALIFGMWSLIQKLLG